MLTNPNRSFFLGVAIVQRRKKKEIIDRKINAQPTVHVKRATVPGHALLSSKRTARTFNRITVRRKRYFVLPLFFDLFRRSSCLALIGQMLLKMSPRLYYCHVEAVNQLRRNAPSDTSQENGTIGTKVSANRCLPRTSKVHLNLSFKI